MSRLSRHEVALREAVKLRTLILRLYDGGKGLTQAQIARKVRLTRARINQIVRSTANGRGAA